MKPFLVLQWRRLLVLLKKEQGFTLIEVLVTITIFSFIMMSVGLVFAEVAKSQRRGFAAQVVQENTMFVLEMMAREIRVSTLQGSPAADCITSFENAITIDHPVNGTVIYALNNGVIQRTADGETADISSSQVSFSRFNICVLGADTDDGEQTRVAIIARVQSVSTSSPHVFTIDVQTTVSVRDVFNDLTN